MQSSAWANIKKLQKIIDEIEASKGKSKIKIPQAWEDFVELTEIRSGGEMKKFTPYPYQCELVELIKKYQNLVVLKSRQIGLTQTVLSIFLHDAALNPASSSVLFMRNSEDATNVSRRARQMLLGLKEYISPTNDNVKFLELKKGGNLHFKNASAEGSRSLDSVTNLFFDEAGFVPKIDQIYAASVPSSALTGDNFKKIICSTPSAKSGFFWEKLSENNQGLDIELIASQVASGDLHSGIRGMYSFVDSEGCCKVVIHYTAHPIYREIPNYLEYRLRQDQTSEEVVQREYNLKFVDSSVSVFSASLINLNAVGNYENSRLPKCRYYCGLDVATVGDDYTVFVVLKLENDVYSIVSLYRRRGETSEFHLYQISQLLKTYKPEITGIEVSGGTGQLYFEQLVKAFPSLHFRRINTTGDSKPKMISTVNLMLEKQELIYPQKCPIIEEFLSFRRQGKKLEAASGKHDDCILAVSFAASVSPFNNSEVSNVDFSKITFHDDDE